MRADRQEHGRVIARYRRHLHVEVATGERVVCLAASRHIDALVGDEVVWRRENDATCVVTEVRPRSSVLTRIDSRGRREPVAANLTCLVAVVAPRPAPDWPLLDRYLAAAELMPATAIIVYNKIDLAAEPNEIAVYRNIGYDVIATSTHRGDGLDALARALDGQRSAMLGQSGVGKSSLINALLGETAQSVGRLTDKGGHGRHTTTTAILYPLGAGGELIDTPGVRHFAPYIERDADVAPGFREFRPLVGRCRFANCRHDAEPDCAVKEAVDAGRIAAERYASFRKLADTLAGLRDARQP